MQQSCQGGKVIIECPCQPIQENSDADGRQDQPHDARDGIDPAAPQLSLNGIPRKEHEIVKDDNDGEGEDGCNYPFEAARGG